MQSVSQSVSVQVMIGSYVTGNFEFRASQYVSHTCQLVLVASRSVSGSTKLDSHEAIIDYN